MDKQKNTKKYELTITAAAITSTDERFTMDNLSLGDGYKPLDAYFKRTNGEVIKRSYSLKECSTEGKYLCHKAWTENPI